MKLESRGLEGEEGCQGKGTAWSTTGENMLKVYYLCENSLMWSCTTCTLLIQGHLDPFIKYDLTSSIGYSYMETIDQSKNICVYSSLQVRIIPEITTQNRLSPLWLMSLEKSILHTTLSCCTSLRTTLLLSVEAIHTGAREQWHSRVSANSPHHGVQHSTAPREKTVSEACPDSQQPLIKSNTEQTTAGKYNQAILKIQVLLYRHQKIEKQLD